MAGKMYEKRPEEDARYHDTWRLLKKYRDVTWSLELSIRQVKNQFRIDYDCSIEDFLESIYMAGADLGGTDIENHARCIERSYKMLTLLENSVNLLRTHHQSGEVYYWILYYSFLSPQKLKNVEEIIEALHPHIRDISFSTYYRLRKAAVEALSSVLWGFSAQDTLKTLDCFFRQMFESILKENWEKIGRTLLLNAKSPYVKLSMLKTINKPKAAAGGRHF